MTRAWLHRTHRRVLRSCVQPASVSTIQRLEDAPTRRCPHRRQDSAMDSSRRATRLSPDLRQAASRPSDRLPTVPSSFPFPPSTHSHSFSKSRSITHSDPHHPDPNPNPHSFASTASPFPRISASDCRDSRECCCLATVFDIACSVLAPRLTRESFAPRGSLILDPAICVLPISDDDAGVIVRRVRAWSIFVRRKAVAWWWCMVDGDVPRGIVLSHSRKVNA